MTHTLGIEFGSTRIKAVLIDEKHCRPVASGDYTWKSDLRERRLDLCRSRRPGSGLRTALRAPRRGLRGLPWASPAMMHGYHGLRREGLEPAYALPHLAATP